MTLAATLTRPAPTLPLDVLRADLIAIDTAVVALRVRALEARGREAFDLGRYLAEAVRRRGEVKAEIAAAEMSP